MSSESSEMHPINYVIGGAMFAGLGYWLKGALGGILILLGGLMFFGGLAMPAGMLIRMPIAGRR
jgi:hypothetical protein